MANASVNPPVIVGIDGSENGLRALDWAAEEAARHRWPIRLVHVVPPVTRRRPALSPVSKEQIYSAALALLSQARRRLTDRGWDDLDIGTSLLEGTTARTLLQAAGEGRMLVLGRRGAGRFAEIVMGSTSLGVTAHARTPVVVVPPAWNPRAPRGRHVLVGVDGSSRCTAAVELAFGEASERRTPLTAVCAWELPNPYLMNPGVVDRELAVWHDEAARTLAESLAGWRAKYPDVAVTELVERGHPVPTLLQLANAADLVVVGGRGHGTVTGMLLGSVARAVLHHVNVPVAVVHSPVDRRGA